MSRCIALVQSRASTAVWNRCPEIASRGDRFCAPHRHALDGAVMGFLDTKEYRHAQAKYREKERRRALRKHKKVRRVRSREQKRERRLRRAQKARNPARALAGFFGGESVP
jgi:IS5 family transposase